MQKINKGFTLIELMTTMTIASILIISAAGGYNHLYQDFKMKNYSSKMEYLAKYAKMTAIQKSSYMGVCANSITKKIILTNMGAAPASSNFNPCDLQSYPKVVKELDFSSDNLSVSNGKYMFDGRGLATQIKNASQAGGSTCISNDRYYSKTIVKLSGIRVQRGDGSCP